MDKTKTTNNIYIKNLKLAKWKMFYMSFIFLLLFIISCLLIYASIICFKQAIYLSKFSNLNIKNSSIVYYFVAILMIILSLIILIFSLWILIKTIFELKITKQINLLFKQEEEIKIEDKKIYKVFKINLNKYLMV